MAPDRGGSPASKALLSREEEDHVGSNSLQAHGRPRNEAGHFLARQPTQGQNFTFRGILVGLGVGTVICFSNMYFGLQTGWVSSMSMPASLIGFAFFKTLSRHLDLPFTEVENVLVQTVAGSMGTMPLGCGFVGVMPALNYMLKPEEQGPLNLDLWQLMLWSLGLCYFGVVFAVPLRRQVIIREKLKFPSGTATALMIGVLHRTENLNQLRGPADTQDSESDAVEYGHLSTLPANGSFEGNPTNAPESGVADVRLLRAKNSWKSRMRLLAVSFAISGLYTLTSYFFPIIRDLPIFGSGLAQSWLWTLNPSLAYVGQGIIMGPVTTLHMLLGTVLGWAVLSPLAKNKGWAPGPVEDWESGSRGWIVWISLAIMLADSVINLGCLVFKSLAIYGYPCAKHALASISNRGWRELLGRKTPQNSGGYSRTDEEVSTLLAPSSIPEDQDVLLPPALQDSFTTESMSFSEVDPPANHLISNRTVWFGLFISVIFCVFCIRITFGVAIPLFAIVTAVFIALVLSIMGVRALGETDLNPVSGISKLAQLFFALIIPQSNKNSVIINLVAGAVSEAGALQAGDLMQDLKTGYLLGAAPNAQFWGQLIGSTVGAIVSALIYQLYTSVYIVPGELFQVPTGYVWIFTARLVTGKGLPEMVWQWALGAAIFFTLTTSFRVAGTQKWWQPYIPGGIAVAVGMYNVPSFTLARAVGGILSWYWRSHRRQEETPIIILASGLILGEGVLSIANLLLASLQVPHF